MRASWMVAWSAAILAGAAVVAPLTARSAALAAVAGSDAAHVVAHLFLYGVLAGLARGAGLSAPRAAALTLGVAAMQEGVQLVVAGRAPGLPELFDLFVDAVATAAVLLAMRERKSMAAPS